MGKLIRMGYRRQYQDFLPRLYPEMQNKVIELAHEKGKDAAIMVKTITFVVGETCNLKCSYCYECNKNPLAIMSKETAKKAVDLILNDSMMNGYMDSKESPALILEFIGGEPLLQIDLMDFVVDYFRYKAFELNHPWLQHYMINITTNGILYNTPKVQQFINKNKAVISCTITIDGDKMLHDACRVFPDGRGSYDIVIESIKLAQKQLGLKTTKVTIAPENQQYISHSIPFLFNLGLTEINANCVYEDVWKKEDCKLFYKELIKLADWMIDNKIYEQGWCSLFDESIGHPMDSKDNKNWCGGNGQMLAIGTDGRLFPCIRFMKYSLQNQELPEFEIGSVDKGIDKEEDNEYLQHLSCITRSSQSTDECMNCPVASGCSWCTAYNYDKFGDPNKRATFICWQHKSRCLANSYYWNKLHKIGVYEKEIPVYLAQEDINYITGE